MGDGHTLKKEISPNPLQPENQPLNELQQLERHHLVIETALQLVGSEPETIRQWQTQAAQRDLAPAAMIEQVVALVVRNPSVLLRKKQQIESELFRRALINHL